MRNAVTLVVQIKQIVVMTAGMNGNTWAESIDLESTGLVTWCNSIYSERGFSDLLIEQ